jgi:hypothetical protein
MADAKQIIQDLFARNRIIVPGNRAALLDEFLKHEQNISAINAIIENENLLINKWKMENKIADIIQQPVRILNATVGKPYEASFGFNKFKWKDISAFEFD